jgi:hypothetical protein
MKSKFKRFEGNGHIWVGDERPVRAWQVECHLCHKTAYVHCHGTNPESVWQRFTKMGWRLSRDVVDDVCGGCIETKKQTQKEQREERQEAQRAANIEALSAQFLINSFQNGHRKHLAEPSTRARVAVALLLDEVLTHNRFELHEAHDLVQLILKYWYLEDDTDRRKEVRAQLKVAAFSPNLKEANAARVEAKRLFAKIDEDREEAIRQKLDEEAASQPLQVKSSVEKFTEKFGGVAKPEPPPAKPESQPPVKSEPLPSGDVEPKWLREAKARMGNWSARK